MSETPARDSIALLAARIGEAQARIRKLQRDDIRVAPIFEASEVGIHIRGLWIDSDRKKRECSAAATWSEIATAEINPLVLWVNHIFAEAKRS